MLAAGAIAAAALVVLPALGWHWMNVDPVLVPPVVSHPSPNAFDEFREAAALISEADAAAALALANPQRPDPRRSSLDRVAAIVRRNRKALDRFRKGLAYPYQEPVPRSVDESHPHFRQFRHLAHVVRLESHLRTRSGDEERAFTGCLDILQLGVAVAYSMSLGPTTGLAIQDIGRRDAWNGLERLPPGSAQRAARRLERICARQIPLPQLLEQEKWNGQLFRREWMRKPGWRRELQFNFGSGEPIFGPGASREDTLTFLRLHATSKASAMAGFAGFMDRAIAVSRQPDGWTAPFPPLPTDPVNQLIPPVLAEPRFQSARARVLNELLLLKLALRAYHEEHQQYPVSLQALSPGYLSALPRDPFAGSTPYRHRRLGRDAVVYSIGPDRRNDLGRPMVSLTRGSSRNPLQRYAIEAGAAGDIVAGINRQ